MMLGVGPGQLTSDAHMLGIPADAAAPADGGGARRDHARCCAARPSPCRPTGSRSQDARLQLRRTATRASTSRSPRRSPRPGPRAAGKLRHRRCCRSPRRDSSGIDLLGTPLAARGGASRASTATTADRRSGASSARCTSPRRRSRRTRTSSTASTQFSSTSPTCCPAGRCPTGRPPTGDHREQQRRRVRVIGTPDDAIAMIDELIEPSNGGFGTFLLFQAHDWATPTATLRSYELFAQYVMPQFQGSAVRPAESMKWVAGTGRSSSARPGAPSCRRYRNTPRRKPRSPTESASEGRTRRGCCLNGGTSASRTWAPLPSRWVPRDTGP